MGKISFPGGGKWIGVNQKALSAAGANSQPMDAEGKALASELRLLMLAWGRMDDNGHAHFEPTHTATSEPGELRRMLGKVDADGVLKPMSGRNIYKIKERLAKAGILVDASGGETCIWVARDMATRDAGYRLCPFHRHSKYGYGDAVAKSTLH